MCGQWEIRAYKALSYEKPFTPDNKFRGSSLKLCIIQFIDIFFKGAVVNCCEEIVEPVERKSEQFAAYYAAAARVCELVKVNNTHKTIVFDNHVGKQISENIFVFFLVIRGVNNIAVNIAEFIFCVEKLLIFQPLSIQ